MAPKRYKKVLVDSENTENSENNLVIKPTRGRPRKNPLGAPPLQAIDLNLVKQPTQELFIPEEETNELPDLKIESFKQEYGINTIQTSLSQTPKQKPQKRLTIKSELPIEVKPALKYEPIIKDEVKYVPSVESESDIDESDISIVELPNIDSNFNIHVVPKVEISESAKKRKQSTFKDVYDSEIDDPFDSESSAKKKRKKALVFSSQENSQSADEKSVLDDSIISISDEEIGDKNKRKRRIKYQKSDESEQSEESDDESNKKLRRSTRQRAKPNRFAEELDVEEETDEAEEADEAEEGEEIQTRRKLRDLISDDELNKDTRKALKEEKARKQRLEQRKQQASNIETTCELEDFFLDVDIVNKKKQLKVDSSIANKMKPHQFEGVKFMWDSCYESVTHVQNNQKGNGCILAHCMGLGKTMQVVALLHTLLSNQELTKCQRVIILLPINVMLNWRTEIEKWTSQCDYQIPIYDLPIGTSILAKEKYKHRLDVIQEWYETGGVFLMGYQMFSFLVHGKFIKSSKMLEEFKKCLVKPGPDLIVCDEGHVLKNDSTGLAQACNQVQTKRRIVLTGTPLQNNLIEYHCMVSFVKNNLLGSLKEFKNRFVNPIYNGQHKDSTFEDVYFMKKRAHVLHQTLEGCVNRKDFAIIRGYLPPKNEYVLSVRLSSKQIELYRTYLSIIRKVKDAQASNLGKIKGAILFVDFHNLMRVWTHPWLLKIHEYNLDRKAQKLKDKEFIDDGDEDECGEMPKTSKKGKKLISLGKVDDLTKKEEDDNTERWYEDLVTPDCEYDMGLSGKLVLFEQILNMCQKIGDKLVVFSQSLMSLDMIERYLASSSVQSRNRWVKDKDYYRIDGQVSTADRKTYIDLFNDEDNTRGRLFIISTKAGGIGINLVGANRCIVFDSTWNPCYDTQSIYRIYRLGQQKEVFVYRFLAQGTMEEKIYIRQVTKNALSQRVIDEHQLDRHFTSEELRELYSFYPSTYSEDSEQYIMPKDDMLKSLLHKNKKWIMKYHEHDSLLENKIDEGLSEAERKAAWDQYEAERVGTAKVKAIINAATNVKNENENDSDSDSESDIEPERNCVIS